MMADDMGYSDVGCYGGEIATPHIDALAARGVRLSQFYNTARCSPSRASLMTGLHPHQVGIGELTNNDGPGGYPGSIGAPCATLAETFKAAGYQTHMTGKWHLSSSCDEPDETWPTRRGFDRFWGTIAGAGSYFQPTTLHDQEVGIPIEQLGEDFYYTDAIGEHAASAIQEAAASGVPFFGYVAFTAPHWPLHARASDREAFSGAYDDGWDELRLRRHARQLESGLCSEDSTVAMRDPQVSPWVDEPDPAWQVARMETYAAQVHAMDRAVGAIIAALDQAGVRENTIVLFLSDNGGCAEELSSEPAQAQRFRQRQRLIIPPRAPDGAPIRLGNSPDIEPGTADTYTSYGQAWANLSNTPFRLYKRWVHEGGISTPLIVDWPDGSLEPGSIVHGPHQLTDVAPTLLEAAGVSALRTRAGVELVPLAGTSMLHALRGGNAVPHPLFWEHIGNAAMRDGQWKVVREHGGRWELYDLEVDRSEQHDLAGEQPERLQAMVSSWQQWAESVGVLPRNQVLEAQSRADTRVD